MQTYAFLSSPETLFSLTANFLDDRHIWTFGDIVSSRSVCGGEEIGVPGFPEKRQPLPEESPMPRGGGLPSSHRSFSSYGIQGNVGAPPGGPELHRHLGAPIGQSGDSRGPEAGDLTQALGLQPHLSASVFSSCPSSRCPPGIAS